VVKGSDIRKFQTKWEEEKNMRSEQLSGGGEGQRLWFRAADGAVRKVKSGKAIETHRAHSWRLTRSQVPLMISQVN